MADGHFVEKTIDVPLNEKGRTIYAERTEHLQKDDPNLACKPSGLPRQGGTPYPLKIIVPTLIVNRANVEEFTARINALRGR